MWVTLNPFLRRYLKTKYVGLTKPSETGTIQRYLARLLRSFSRVLYHNTMTASIWSGGSEVQCSKVELVTMSDAAQSEAA
jgi:hypothetical protein